MELALVRLRAHHGVEVPVLEEGDDTVPLLMMVDDDKKQPSASGSSKGGADYHLNFKKRQLLRFTSLPSRILDSSDSEDSPEFLSDFDHHRDQQEEEQQHFPVLLLRQPYVSLEQLNPSPECQTRKATSLSAMFNLVATVCGGGVLSLPLAFARAGIIPTTCLMVYACVTTDFTLYLLVACARRTGGRSYGHVAKAAFGSLAQLVTTLSLATMLLGTLIAYQVLLRDLWSSVIYHIVPSIQSKLLELSRSAGRGEDPRMVDNLLLGFVLLLAFPLLLKKDLHALRYTCYVGFSSCLLLLLAVTYRAYQKMEMPHAHQPIKWYSTNLGDYLFAYPIVLLCFFCSFNVLSIHSQLVHPTRERMRAVLDGSLALCFCLFYGIGLGGYLYTGQDALDNILLNFSMDDQAVLAGRSGYCFTILFGLPMVLLPLRETVIGLPEQFLAWRDDVALIGKYQRVAGQREAGAHLIVNGVDFDAEAPVMKEDPKFRHGTLLTYYGACSTTAAETPASPPTTPMSAPSVDETVSTAAESVEDLTLEHNLHHHHRHHDELSTSSVVGDHDHHHHHLHNDMCCCCRCNPMVVHVVSTLVLLSVSYAAAVSVAGVAVVWSIFGSSIAIFIGFIVPTACYLKIREHKGLTARSFCGGLLLAASCISAVVCTRQAVLNAFAS